LETFAEGSGTIRENMTQVGLAIAANTALHWLFVLQQGIHMSVSYFGKLKVVLLKYD
jgi:hypothetical protein